jgi:hypothetical protein
MCLRALFFLTFLISAIQVCFGANYYVNDNSIVGDYFCTATGNNLNSGLSPSSPKASLTNLLSTYSGILTSGDVIYVDAGTYSDVNITLSINGISIIGAGPASTRFDNNFASSDANRLFTVTGDNIVLQGFYVTEYNRGTGGATAIQISGALNLTINNVLTDENRQGGGSSTIVIDGGSSVTFNGGGSNCNSLSPSVAGGGVNVEGNGNTVTFNNYSFSNNSKDYEGGSGLYIVGNNTTTVTVNNSIFADNRNTNAGGAIFISGSNLTVNNSCFTNNSTFSGSGPKYGGAVTVGRGATLNFTNCTFTNNSVTNSGNGGAIGINTSIAGSGTTATVNLNTCTFTGNIASSQGNHLFARVGSSNPAIFNITNCTFSASTQNISNDNTAVINIQNSGNPSTSGTVNLINTTPPSSVASTNCPVLQGSCYGVILPVELTSFDGACTEGLSALKWSTASEHNNAYFTIEKSSDGAHFWILATVDGMLNKTTETNYSFLDMESKPGVNYYRLSQTDTDGTIRILKTISVLNDCTLNGLDEMGLIVNGAQNELILLFNLERPSNVELTVTNPLGQQLLIQSALLEKQERIYLQLPLSLAAGVYHLTVFDGETTVNKKFLINK